MKFRFGRRFWIVTTAIILVFTVFVIGRHVVHAVKIKRQINALNREKRATSRRSPGTAPCSNSCATTTTWRSTPASTTTCSAATSGSTSSRSRAAPTSDTPVLFASAKKNPRPQTGIFHVPCTGDRPVRSRTARRPARYTRPEKPMKAMARIPAVMSAMGTPRNDLGTSSKSRRSRIPAKRISARAKPRAVDTE